MDKEQSNALPRIIPFVERHNSPEEQKMRDEWIQAWKDLPPLNPK